MPLFSVEVRERQEGHRKGPHLLYKLPQSVPLSALVIVMHCFDVCANPGPLQEAGNAVWGRHCHTRMTGLGHITLAVLLLLTGNTVILWSAGQALLWLLEAAAAG